MEALFVSVDLGLLATVELLELDVLVSIIIVAIVLIVCPGKNPYVISCKSQTQSHNVMYH